MAIAADVREYLRITPTGNLRPAADWTQARGPEPAAAAPTSALRRSFEAFQTDTPAGLFELAAHLTSGGLPPQLAYWRDFAALYLGERCHTPTGVAELPPVPPPSPADTMTLQLSAPPMQGAEFLTQELLHRLWTGLDEWTCAEAARAGGLEAFLSARAPLWRQVGRVCFHLAENKKDSAFPFAFLATYAPRLSSSAGIRYQPLSRALQELAGERNRKALIHLLTPVERAAEASPLIRQLVDSRDIYHPIAWTSEDAYRFLQEIPVYERSGVLVRVPDWWARRSRPMVAVRIGSESRGMLGLDALLDFRIEVAVGDDSLTEKEIRQLQAGSDGLVFLKGRWVEIDRQKLSEALLHWQRMKESAAEEGISFAEGMRLLAGASVDLGAPEEPDVAAWSFVEAGGWLKQLLEQLRAPEAIESTLPGRELHATLRHYQETGVRWLRLLSGLGLGDCLADDMGLGKTIQVLGLLLLLRKQNARPSLLVLPASLLANWKAEIERFAPSLRIRFLHPSFGPLPSDPTAVEDLADTDAVLTTYGMAARQPWLESVSWTLLVLDEAQAIKNPGARQTKAVKRLRAKARIALTGTPVENRLSDLWSLFDFLCPGLLGSLARFSGFARELEKKKSERFLPIRNLVRPYILRRMKTDTSVIADLPEKTVVPAWCGMTKEQAALYKRVVDDLAEGLEGREGIQRRGLVLAALLRLKQVCNHPSHLRGDGRWEPEGSGKFARLREIGEEIASRQDRALVFTQFREMTEPLAVFLAGVSGRPGLVLHGQTRVSERQKLVEAFQADDGPPFFVLSLKAGGTGLNLTAASHVIHFDRWWNPAVENQATDRAFRIGQKKNVLVHTFICRGTVEEKIDELIRQKTALARDVLETGGETLLTEMSDDELLSAISLDIERARAE
jgi:superfamily II DNA or RNA helicase